MQDDWMRDISGLGGFPLYATAVGVALAWGALDLALQLVAALAASHLLTYGLRLLWPRERPEIQTASTPWQRIDASSFPSLHTLRGSAFWTLVALYGGGWATFLIALGVIALLIWSRVWLRRHHLSDALAGAALGLAVAFAVNAVL